MNGKVSLACALINVVFAFQAYASSNWLLFGICIAFAVYCGRNYRNANKEVWDN